MDALRIINCLLQEVGASALDALDRHCQLVHDGVNEAEEEEAMYVRGALLPIDGNNEDRVWVEVG